MKTYKKQIEQFRIQIFVVVTAHILSFLFAMPILWLEQGAEGANIKTMSDSLYFMFTTVTTIGYGNLVVVDEVSKVLVVVSFVITRASFLVAIFSLGAGMGKHRKRHEMSVEDRLLVMENEMKQMRGVIYNLNKLLECEVKHVKSIDRKVSEAEIKPV